MKQYILFLLALFLSSYSFSQEDYGTFISEGQVENVVYKIYSQRNCFKEFIDGYKNDTVADYKLWEETIFNKTHNYLEIEFNKSQEADLEYVKRSYYKFHCNILKEKSIIENTQLFEENIEDIVQKTVTYYGDLTDTIHVIILPYAGQGGTVKNIGHRNSIMPIGVNLVKSVKTLNSIVPHEYTHRYNQLKNGLPESNDIWVNEAKMFWSLWGEGMATYGTGMVTNNFDIDNLLLSSKYENFPKDIIDYENLDSWLAKEFLKQHNDPLIDYENDSHRTKWFASNSKALRADLPPAIGYYLGYKVVKYCVDIEGYSFYDLLTLRPEELKKISKLVLKKMESK